MRPFPPRAAASALVAAGLLTGLVATTGPAHAATGCAPDPYEADSPGTAAPLTVGETLTRAICQAPTPQPRTQSAQDRDYSVFTARGGTAYTVAAVEVGAALADDAFGTGGLDLGVARLNPDGTTSSVEQTNSRSGDVAVTPVLPAGRYVVYASTDATQVYPEANTMDVATIQGSQGTYGIRVEESAAAPVVSSLRLSSSTVKGGKPVNGTYTLSAPAPSGGMYVYLSSTHSYNAAPGAAYVAAGTTQVPFTVATRASSSDLRVTLTAWSGVGAARSTTLTVRR